MAEKSEFSQPGSTIQAQKSPPFPFQVQTIFAKLPILHALIFSAKHTVALVRMDYTFEA